MFNKEIRLKAVAQNSAEVAKFLNDFLREVNCDSKNARRILTIADELFANISRYAYGEDIGFTNLKAVFDDNTVTLIFTDSGKSFDPTKYNQTETRKIGGRGILLVSKLADSFEYNYKDSQNITTVSKIIKI